MGHLRYEPLAIAPFAPLASIAVPSRLYFEKSIEKPFNGLRVAVKDIFDLKGVKTAGSSRSYNQLYPPRDKSATAVEMLIEKGAIIVGKTKTTTFADREIPTTDWIDTHAPFNPRGDGYLVPGGSSAGSGSALSSYDWLDFAIGTDSKYHLA
jgi:Asp-tRNA(Asn)/Glu-tRNA(Gln) amidotransferase A subunit family amidase